MVNVGDFSGESLPSLPPCTKPCEQCREKDDSVRIHHSLPCAPPRAEYCVCTLQGIQTGTLRLQGALACTAVGRLNPSCLCIQSPEWVADLPFCGLRCAFCLGHRSWPREAPAFHLSLSTQFREAGLRWQLWLRGLMHLSGEQSRCQATARVVGGNHVAPNFPLPGWGLGPGPRWEKLGKGRREGPEPGIWWPGRSWDEKGGKHVGQSLAEPDATVHDAGFRVSKVQIGVLVGPRGRGLARRLEQWSWEEMLNVE